MAQYIGSVSNGNGQEVRAAMNKNFNALFTSNSGSSPPTPSFEGQTWLNTGASPNRFSIRKPTSGFVPLRDVEGRVILPTTGYSGVPSKTATPAFYFDGHDGTGFFHFAPNIIGFATENTIHYVLGRSLGGRDDDGNFTLNQQNAFVIGPAAFQEEPLSPSNAGRDETASAGFCVADSGQCHIGSTARPLTLNKILTADLKGDTSLLNFNVDGKFKGAIVFDPDDGGSLFIKQNKADYRVQENVSPIKSAKASINKLKPIKFNLIGYKAVMPGFTAHEVQEALPEYHVSGEKDEVDSEGNPMYQHINYDMFPPLLTAALQEAFAEIAALTKRVKTLEGKN